MKIIVAVMLGLMPVATPAGQTEARKSGAIVVADYDYGLRVDSCTVSGQGDAATLSGRLFVRFQPDQRLAPGDGIAVDVAPSPAGGAPTVSAKAINTKGTGATLRTASPVCTAADPLSVRRGGGVAATCTVSEAGDGVAVAFSLPLDSAKTGHVTLMKRGDSMDGATVAASCTSAKPMRASWDLATLKK